jgi:hypothetical protein
VTSAEKEQPERDRRQPDEAADENAPRQNLRASEGPLRCPYCHADVNTEANDWVACRQCLARHHASCWREHGACATCGQRRALRASLHSADPRRHRPWATVLPRSGDGRLGDGRLVWEIAILAIFTLVVGGGSAAALYANGNLKSALAASVVVIISDLAVLLNLLARAARRDHELLERIREEHRRRMS